MALLHFWDRANIQSTHSWHHTGVDGGPHSTFRMHTGGGADIGQPGYPNHQFPSNLYYVNGRRTHIGSFNVQPYIQYLANLTGGGVSNGGDIAQWAIVRSHANHPGYILIYTPDTTENTFLRPTLELVFYGEGPPTGTPPTANCYGQLTVNLGEGNIHNVNFNYNHTAFTTQTFEFTTGATVDPNAYLAIHTSNLVGRFEVEFVSLADVTPDALTQVLTLDPTTTFQTMEGFGFFGARNVWWGSGVNAPFIPEGRYRAFYQGGTPKNDTEWIDFLLLELGLTMWRNELYPFLPAYSLYATNPQDTNWDAQKHFVKALNDRAVELGIDLRIIVTVWSPPGEWKYNQHTRSDLHAGSPPPPLGVHRNDWNRLMPAHYVDYAYWLVSALEIYREIGVEVYAISPQNEPYFHQFFNSSFYTAAQFVEMLETVIPIINTYFPDVYIFGAEGMLGHEQSVAGPGWVNPNMQYHRHILGQPILNAAGGVVATPPGLTPALLDNFVFAVHGYYDGVYAQALEMHPRLWAAERAMLGPYHRSWMTETSGYHFNWIAGNPRPGSLSLAMAIQSAIVYGDLSAWVWWQGSELGTGGGGYYTMMRPNSNRNKIVVHQHFYRYIRPGAVRIGAELSIPSENLMVSAFNHAEMDNDVIVLVNFGNNEYTLSIEGVTGTFDSVITTGSPNYLVPGPQVTADSGDTIVIPPNSVITMVRGEYREPYTPDNPAMTPAQMDNRDVEIAATALESISARGTTFVTSSLLAYSEASALNVARNLVGRHAFFVDWEIVDSSVVFTPAIDATPSIPGTEGSLIFQVRVSQGAFNETTANLILRIIPIEQAAGYLTVDLSETHQVLEGLGIMGGAASWGRLDNPTDYFNAAWINAVVNELGVSMWRTTLSGNYPVYATNPHVYLTHEGINWPIPQTNWEMQRPLVEAMAAAQSDDDPLRVIITVNSPPANMKVRVTGAVDALGIIHRTNEPHPYLRGGTLDPTLYEDFAAWLIAGIEMYKEAGALVYGLSLTNEPLFPHPFYEYALYTPAWYMQMIDNVAPIVNAAFPDVRIFGAQSIHMFELAGWNANARYTTALLANPQTLNLMGVPLLTISTEQTLYPHPLVLPYRLWRNFVIMYVPIAKYQFGWHKLRAVTEL